VPADFVVDASGRGTVTLSLLDRLGLPRPRETSIGVDISYATALFDVPHDVPSDWKGVATFARIPNTTVSALMLPIEGSRWMATLAAMHANGAPQDMDQFLACAKALPTPTLFDAIGHLKGASDVARFAFPASVWRHFELLTSFPRGLIPIADTICRLNPVYGQGMSVAAHQACLLRTLMKTSVTEDEPPASLALAFFMQAHGLVETPWAMAANMELAHPATRGHRASGFGDQDGVQ
jgi:2-polyprenyl-6-methoxyphenol hydroxylase-like FAD-dependent oxidoreductase